MRKLYRMILTALALVALVSQLAPSTAHAADFRSGDRVVIAAGEVVNQDLFVRANELVIDGTVKGSVIGYADVTFLNGAVEGDLIIAGRSLNVNGTLGGALRTVGQFVTLTANARIARGVMGGGQFLTTEAGSTIGNDLIFFGQQALLRGSVQHNFVGGALFLNIQGTVGQTQTSFLKPQISPTLVSFTSHKGGYAAFLSSALQQAPNTGDLQNWLLAQVRRFSGLLIVGLIALLLVPASVKRLADTVEHRPLPSFGWGIVAWIVLVLSIVGLILLTIFFAIFYGSITLGDLAGLVVLVGITLGLVWTTAVYLFINYIIPLVLSYLGGRWILARARPEWKGSPVFPFILGLILYVILTGLPTLGDFISAVLDLIGLGALWLVVTANLRVSTAPEATQPQLMSEGVQVG